MRMRRALKKSHGEDDCQRGFVHRISISFLTFYFFFVHFLLTQEDDDCVCVGMIEHGHISHFHAHSTPKTRQSHSHLFKSIVKKQRDRILLPQFEIFKPLFHSPHIPTSTRSPSQNWNWNDESPTTHPPSSVQNKVGNPTTTTFTSYHSSIRQTKVTFSLTFPLPPNVIK